MKRIARICICIFMVIRCIGVAFGEMSFSEYCFEDFTMILEKDCAGTVNEKTDGQQYFSVFPEYSESADYHQQISCMWNEGYWRDISKVNLQEYAEMCVKNVNDTGGSAGIRIENYKLVDAQFVKIDNVPSMMIIAQGDYDYTEMGFNYVGNVYNTTFVMSEERFGTYTFALLANDIEQMKTLIMIMEMMEWNE